LFFKQLGNYSLKVAWILNWATPPCNITLLRLAIKKISRRIRVRIFEELSEFIDSAFLVDPLVDCFAKRFRFGGSSF
jgi:hypothetical protein